MENIKINLGLEGKSDDFTPINPIVDGPVVDPGNPVDPVTQNEPVVDPVSTDVVDNLDKPQIDIDGVIYNIDDKGNAVDEQGNIKYTAEKIKELEQGQDGFDINSVIELVNIKPLDEKGEFINYESSQEGLSQYVADVYAVGRNQAIAEYEEELVSKYPLLPDILKHLELTGSLEGFNKKVDYSTFDLKEDNVDQHKQIIIEARLLRGDTPEKAQRYAKMLEDSKATYEEAQEELQFLVSKDAEAKAEYDKQLANKVKADKEAAEKYWGIKIENGKLVPLNVKDSIYDLIQKGTLKIGEDVYTIPDRIMIKDGAKVTYATRDDFFNYLYSPVTVNIDGKPVKTTRHDLDLYNENQNRNTSHDLFDAYKRFVKYDTSQMIKSQVQKNEIKKLNTKINIRQNNRTPVVTSPDDDRIVIKRN